MVHLDLDTFLCPCTPQICGSNGPLCRGTLLQVRFLTCLHLCNLLSFRKLPVTPCLPTANHFVIMPSSSPCSSTPCSSSPCSPPSSLKLGSFLRPAVCCLAQFCAPAHLRSASAMALRAGAPSQRLHLCQLCTIFDDVSFRQTLLCDLRPQASPQRVPHLQHLRQLQQCPSPAQCPNSFASRLPCC